MNSRITSYTSLLQVESTETETQNGAQIAITIYAAPHGFLFGVNCKLRRFVRSCYPQPHDKPLATKKEARAAALAKIKSWICDSRKLQKIFWQFDLSEYEQLELFDYL